MSNSINLVRSSCHFAVYKHQLILNDAQLISRQFVVIKDIQNTIISFTKLHRHIHSKDKYGSKSVSDDGNNRFQFVVQFLNYAIFTNYQKYHIDRICDIRLHMLQDFFHDYGLDEKKRSKETVNRCLASVMDFLISYVAENKKDCVLKLSDFTREVTYRTRRGAIKTMYVPNFNVYHSGKVRTIFRDMPNSVFNLFLSYAAQYYKDIFFAIVLSAFAGLRPSESCNVRQEISPLGSGIIFKQTNGITRRIMIDLREVKNLRMDKKPVGQIKKERMQGVYPRFIKAFEYCYKLHKDYLSTRSFEAEYCPMIVNTQGKAMTYSTYRARFRKMTRELIPVLFQSSDAEVVEYAHELSVNNISPHIFRHWFSVRLTLYGEDVAGIQYWRGDKNPESALTYLQNKGELEKQLHYISDGMFEFMLEESRKENEE